MSDVSTWSPLDGDNNLPPPDGWPEFMMPSGVNNVGRMMMGAVRRMYDKQVAGDIVLPYLKLAGGQTVTGAVTFSAGIIASGITSNGVINAASTISTTGGISASGNVSGGSISTGGAINGGNITAAGEINAAGRINAGYVDISGSHLAVKLSGGMYYHDNAGTPGLVLYGDGNAGFNNNILTFNDRGGGLNATLSAGGFVVSRGGIAINAGGLTVSGVANIGNGLNVTGPIHTITSASGGDIVASGALFAWGDTGFGLLKDVSDNRVLRFTSQPYEFFMAVPTGTLIYQGVPGQIWVMQASGTCYAPRGPVGGNGDYWNVSDRRFKDAATITAATQGLPEILQLQPVEFQRLPPQDSGDGTSPAWELGFVAQDVAPVLPEAVSVVGVELPDGTGGMSDPNPTLAVTSGAIVAALVNAAKTLDASIKALETRLTAGGL